MSTIMPARIICLIAYSPMPMLGLLGDGVWKRVALRPFLFRWAAQFAGAFGDECNLAVEIG